MAIPKLHLRDLFWLLLVVALGCAWGIDHQLQQLGSLSPRLLSQQTLQRDATGEILLTHHAKTVFIGTTVYQVWTRADARDEWEPLFTVEEVFQEAEPGVPMLIESASGPRLTDERGSFEFDPATKSFVKNKVPAVVYSGAFRCFRP